MSLVIQTRKRILLWLQWPICSSVCDSYPQTISYERVKEVGVIRHFSADTSRRTPPSIFILKGLKLLAGGLNAVNTPGNDVLLLATPQGVEANLAVTTSGFRSHANVIRGCRFTQLTAKGCNLSEIFGGVDRGVSHNHAIKNAARVNSRGATGLLNFKKQARNV